MFDIFSVNPRTNILLSDADDVGIAATMGAPKVATNAHLCLADGAEIPEYIAPMSENQARVRIELFATPLSSRA